VQAYQGGIGAQAEVVQNISDMSSEEVSKMATETSDAIKDMGDSMAKAEKPIRNFIELSPEQMGLLTSSVDSIRVNIERIVEALSTGDGIV